MNFVDVDRERYCLGCWTKKSNPEHPEIEQIVEKVEAEVEVWRCQKHTRDENGLPDGPKSCLLYTSPSPRDVEESRMPSSA